MSGRGVVDAAFALGYMLLGLWLLFIGREGPMAFCILMGLLFLSLGISRGFDAAGVRDTRAFKEEEL